MNGKIVDIVRTFEGKFRVTFEVDSVNELNGLTGMLHIIVKRVSTKRSLTANAYFHVLVGEIAEAQRPPISKARAKNILLGRYGQREIINDGQLKISVRSDIDMLEREDLHVVPVGHGYVNDTEFTHYAIVRGSHTYTTREMAMLIDGTVEEAKALGIPTMTPRELEHIKSLWKGYPDGT